MSVISYRGVSLDIVKTNECSRRAVYSPDGMDFLYMEWTLDVDCVLNPSATSYENLSVESEPDPTPVQGNFPRQTDLSIRQYMLQPRGRLVYTIIDPPYDASPGTEEELLYSPRDGYTVDCKNGPQPELFDIIAPMNRTFLCRFRIKTWVNDCTGDGSVAPTNAWWRPIVLSHRWTMIEDIDEDYWVTRTIRGQVIFNTAELKKAGLHPDQFRKEFFHPLPRNFKRWNIDVAAESDGTGCSYSFVDREEKTNITCRRVSRMEVSQTQNVSDPDIVQAVGFASVVAKREIDRLARRELPNMQQAVQGAIAAGELAKYGINGIRGLWENRQSLLPSAYAMMILQLWGSRTTVRNDLMYLGMNIALNKLRSQLSVSTHKNITITQDLMGKHVIIQIEVHHSPVAASLYSIWNDASKWFVRGRNPINAGEPRDERLFADTPNGPRVAVDQESWAGIIGGNLPLNSYGGRSIDTYSLVAAALGYPCRTTPDVLKATPPPASQPPGEPINTQTPPPPFEPRDPLKFEDADYVGPGTIVTTVDPYFGNNG